MKDLIIVGASGFGRELLQWCKEINSENQKWNIKGFLDDNLAALDGYGCDYSVIGKIQEYQPQANDVFAIALADPSLKKRIIELLESKGAEFVSIIHPDAKIGERNKIGKSVIIYPSARITVDTEIGDYVAILDRTTIGHDATIGKYTSICGNCSINGHVHVGEEVFMGNSATVAPGRKIGNKAFVGIGSVVISNVREGYKVFGCPAKKISL